MKSLGIPVINLGGGDAERADFKIRFGARGRPPGALKKFTTKKLIRRCVVL